ncbi:stAR-related lipid transfer protein 6, partial [Calypte anna]|uniref:stAR-related lipid transfer protein 6 n=1 Tax=Calypte anna TaxID=9244 RepID=UPI0011C49A01
IQSDSEFSPGTRCEPAVPSITGVSYFLVPLFPSVNFPLSSSEDDEPKLEKCQDVLVHRAGRRYRGEGIIKEVPSKIIPFMYLPEYRSKWDKALQSYKLLERIDQDTGIYHSVTQSYGMGLISSRDFVDLLHVKPYPGGILTTNSVSVEYSSCPPTPSCVRGFNNPCGYVCSPLPENPQHSKLVVFIQPELGGRLPCSVVETALPTTLINLITETRAGLQSLKDQNET